MIVGRRCGSSIGGERGLSVCRRGGALGGIYTFFFFFEGVVDRMCERSLEGLGVK